mgnify:CR=1 FL=1
MSLAHVNILEGKLYALAVGIFDDIGWGETAFSFDGGLSATRCIKRPTCIAIEAETASQSVCIRLPLQPREEGTYSIKLPGRLEKGRIQATISVPKDGFLHAFVCKSISDTGLSKCWLVGITKFSAETDE